MASESIAHSAYGSWAIGSDPIRARGIIVNYLPSRFFYLMLFISIIIMLQVQLLTGKIKLSVYHLWTKSQETVIQLFI